MESLPPNFIENLNNETEKPFRVEIRLKLFEVREVRTTYALTLDEALGQIAAAMELPDGSFESGRVFDDSGVNVYEVDYREKASATMMDF